MALEVASHIQGRRVPREKEIGYSYRFFPDLESGMIFDIGGIYFRILAYASMADYKNITCCLVYPCKAETFISLSKRNRTTHKATLAMNDRVIDLRLTALPLNLSLSDAAMSLRTAIIN